MTASAMSDEAGTGPDSISPETNGCEGNYYE